MTGHTDTVTGIRLSPDGNRLLSNGMDNTVRVWDVAPFCPALSRAVTILEGAQHNYEKNLIKGAWTPDGRRIGCGSADRMVYVWDVASRALMYALPGHKGCVNEVDFHPKAIFLYLSLFFLLIFLHFTQTQGSLTPLF